MIEYIDRKTAIASLCCDCSATGDCRPNERCVDYQRLKGIPAADVRLVIKGKWHDCYHQLMPNCYVAVCSSCGEKHEYIGGGFLKYCPNCGADMRGDNI